MLVQVDFDIMYLCAQILKSSKVRGLEHSGKVMSKVIKAHQRQFMLGVSLRVVERANNEVYNLFIFSLFGFDQFQNTYSPLGVVNRRMNSCSTVCQLIMDPLRRFVYLVNASPFNDYTKSCNNNVSRTDNGRFITGPHLEIK